MNLECIICGHNEYVEKHHPDGTIIIHRFINKKSKNYTDIKLIDEESNSQSIYHDKFVSQGIMKKQILKKYKNKDNWVWMCPNHHRLLHKYNLTIEELKERECNIETFEQEITKPINNFGDEGSGNQDNQGETAS